MPASAISQRKATNHGGPVDPRLDPAVHQEFKRRADQERMSMQAYVSRVLSQHTARPTIAQWLQRLDDQPRYPDVSGAEAVREARADAR